MDNLAATGFTVAAAAVSIVLGVIYLVRPQFLRYHSVAVQQDWDELNPRFQTLVLALMRVASGGMLSAGVTIALLQWQFNRGPQPWLPWVIVICGGVLILASLYGMSLVRGKTKGRPPIAAAVLALVSLLVGLVLNLRHLD